MYSAQNGLKMKAIDGKNEERKRKKNTEILLVSLAAPLSQPPALVINLVKTRFTRPPPSLLDGRSLLSGGRCSGDWQAWLPLASPPG